VKEKVVKEKVVKEKVVAEKKEEVKAVKEVKEKKVAEKKEKKEVKAKAVEAKEVEVVAEKAVTEKKARAPSLPAKYGKFIQYSYYLIRAINNAALEQNGAVLVDEDQFIAAAHVFDNIANQQAFVASFLENKNIAKEMRTHLADKKKAEVVAAKAAAKAEKEAEKNAIKAAAKAEKDAAKAAAKPAKQPKETKSKAKKTKKAVDPDLVTSLVALANTSLAPTATAAAAAEIEEEELDVRVFMINAKEYLIDDNNNLYDSNSHAVIGIWNKETNAIIHA
jgi:colicin import membrane protein